MYNEYNPKWVKAEEVKYAKGSKKHVDVKAYGEKFEYCKLEWNSFDFDKNKSDVLVQNNRGDWLRVWFYDEDILT